MSDKSPDKSPLEFIKGVNRLHAFYTENVRMLAHAYDLSEEEAARILHNFDYRNVARAILHPPRVSLIDGLPAGAEPVEEEGQG